MRVDGRSADIVEADGFFLGVDVPAGTRTVEFSYEPRWLVPSLILAVVGLAAICALLVASRLRPRDLKTEGYSADRAVEQSSIEPT